MVRINTEMLLRCASHTKKHTNESDLQYLKRLTHIYFQERGIEEIEGLHLCKSLSVLYLYDNLIPELKNLSFATNLTHLYLQKNKIQHISGICSLKLLQKLYIGYNCIIVIEGLEQNTNLTELHIEYQNLPVGEKLLFDPISLEAISNALLVLNVSGNNIDECGDMKPLCRLNHLIMKNNNLTDVDELCQTLTKMRALCKLELSGNPLCKEKKFKDIIIVTSSSLVMIDNKEVSDSTRHFLQNLYANREALKQSPKRHRNPKDEEEYFMGVDDAVIPDETFRQGYFAKHHQRFAQVLARHYEMNPSTKSRILR